jgi:hypothetical protein
LELENVHFLFDCYTFIDISNYKNHLLTIRKGNYAQFHLSVVYRKIITLKDFRTLNCVDLTSHEVRKPLIGIVIRNHFSNATSDGTMFITCIKKTGKMFKKLKSVGYDKIGGM